MNLTRVVNTGCHYHWNCPPLYLFFRKFSILSRKWHDILCIVCIFMLHNLHRTYIRHWWYIKKKPMVVVPSIFTSNSLTPPLIHSQPWKYYSAKEKIFLLKLHISHSENALSSAVSLYSTLIAYVFRDYNAAFLCHCQFLLTVSLWWGCWYANISPSDKKST